MPRKKPKKMSSWELEHRYGDLNPVTRKEYSKLVFKGYEPEKALAKIKRKFKY